MGARFFGEIDVRIGFLGQKLTNCEDRHVAMETEKFLLSKSMVVSEDPPAPIAALILRQSHS